MSLASSPPPRRVSLSDSVEGENALDSAQASTSPRQGITSPSSWLARRRRSSRAPSASSVTAPGAISADTSSDSHNSPLSPSMAGQRTSSVKYGLKNVLGLGKSASHHSHRSLSSSSGIDGLPGAVSHEPSGLGLTSAESRSRDGDDSRSSEHHIRPSSYAQRPSTSGTNSVESSLPSDWSSSTQRLAMQPDAASQEEDLLALEPGPMTDYEERSARSPTEVENLTTREILNGAGSSRFLHNRLPAGDASPTALLDSVGKGSAALHSPTTRKGGPSYLERMRSVGSGHSRGDGSSSSERRRLGQRNGSGESHSATKARMGLPLEFRDPSVLPDRAQSVASNYLPANYDPELVDRHRRREPSSRTSARPRLGQNTDDRSESASTISRASVYQSRPQRAQQDPTASSISRSHSLRLSGGSTHESPRRAVDNTGTMATVGRLHRNGSSMSISRGGSATDYLNRSQSVYGDLTARQSPLRATASRHSGLTPSRSVASNLSSADFSQPHPSPTAMTTEEARAEAKRRRQSLLRDRGANIEVTPHRTLKLSGGLRDRFLYSEPRPASSIGSPSRLDRHLPPGTTPSPTRTTSRMGGEQTVPRSAPAHLKLNRASLILPGAAYRDFVPESPLAHQRDRAASRMSLVESRRVPQSTRHDRSTTSPTGSTFTTMTTGAAGGTAARAMTNRVLAALRKANSKETRALLEACWDLFEALPDEPALLPLRNAIQQAVNKADKMHVQLAHIESDARQQSADCETMSPEEAQMTAIAGYQELVEQLGEAIRTSSEHMSSLTGVLRTMAEGRTRPDIRGQGDMDLTRSFSRLAMANGSAAKAEATLGDPRAHRSPSQRCALDDDAGSSSGGSSVVARSRRSQYAPSPQGTPRGSSAATARSDWVHPGLASGQIASSRDVYGVTGSPPPISLSDSQPLTRRRSNASTIGQRSSASTIFRSFSSQAPTTALSQVNAGLADESPTEADFAAARQSGRRADVDATDGEVNAEDTSSTRGGGRESPRPFKRSLLGGGDERHFQPRATPTRSESGSAYDRLSFVKTSERAR